MEPWALDVIIPHGLGLFHMNGKEANVFIF